MGDSGSTEHTRDVQFVVIIILVVAHHVLADVTVKSTQRRILVGSYTTTYYLASIEHEPWEIPVILLIASLGPVLQ